MSRTYQLTRPHELGAEWTADDLPKGFTGTIALDIDRESFMWALVWTPPTKFMQPWIEQTDEGPYHHEAIRPIRAHGKELTKEDAMEEIEKAYESMKPKVKKLNIEELAGPGKPPKKAKKR